MATGWCPFASQDVVLFMMGRGGGGHKASAIALRDCLLQEGVAWASNIQLIDAAELVEEAIHGRLANVCISGDDLYNRLMQRGFYQLAGLSGHIATTAISGNRKRIACRFAQLWDEWSPALVVSFVPFLNAIMRASLLSSRPSCHLVTVVTDMASSSAHRWIDPSDPSARNHTIVAGTATLEHQARELGYGDQVLRTSGMVVHPTFYKPMNAWGSAEPPAPGDSTSRRVAVIFFGGCAPMRVASIARNAMASHPTLSLVVLCGSNVRLRQRLRKLSGDRCVVEGFIPAARVREHFMRACIVIGKPGPGVAVEASVCGVPLVTERRRVMPQEKCVLEWLESTLAGVVVKSLEDLPANLFESAEVSRRALRKAEPNRAVFEVSAFLQQLASAGADRAAAPERPASGACSSILPGSFLS